MEKQLNENNWQPAVGDFVEDLSGIIGKVISNTEYLGMVRVAFSNDYTTNYRDLQIKQLKPARYAPEQLERMKRLAPELLESLNLMTALCRIKYGNLDKDVYAEIEKAEALIVQAIVQTKK